jgi:hypothetical protein
MNMGGASKKSRKQSGGKPTAQQRLRDSCVFYLDEGLSECKALHAVFTTHELRFERHYVHFPDRKNGTEDHVWLELVGRNDWIAITKDKGIRYLPLERELIKSYKIRQFSFSSGTMSGGDMAAILEAHLRAVWNCILKTERPFVAALNKGGVQIRWQGQS